jgi:hypothetical protein
MMSSKPGGSKARGPRHPLEGGVAEAVVQAPALGVGHHLVGLDQLLEALLRRLTVLGVLVGVQLEGELAVRLLDLVVRGGARDPENLVVVALHETRKALTRARVRAPLLSAPDRRKPKRAPTP